MTKRFTDLTLEEYLNELASDKPVPGGGSVSAYVASLAMGLIQMVGRISLKRKIKAGLSAEEIKKEEMNRETIKKIIESIEKTKRDSFQIVNLDPQVYQQVLEASGNAEKMEDALKNSFRLQADLAFLVAMAHEWNQSMAGLVKGSIKNDLLVAASLLEAAFHGAYHTAMINVKYMQDGSEKDKSEKALEALKKRYEEGNVSVSRS